ncbi:hypothetical protein [Wolbachia endosymbiont (group A) of Sphecodes monilicornis]|uniref:hypothetical protein n=1 Tax=Wolbachia endosymbiont (group A) of Sphecodes monilicornis TaxID=2954060 RepID=UPI0022307B2F|nr:hypothetical protein [Wolbachia endosymbiont (group A) of Sphecodes monilicornis]
MKDALLGFAVASTNINEPKEITFKEQKIFAMISQKFCKDIKKYLPNYDRNIPKEDEYKIIIEKLPEVKVMQDFAQGKSVNNNTCKE